MRSTQIVGVGKDVQESLAQGLELLARTPEGSMYPLELAGMANTIRSAEMVLLKLVTPVEEPTPRSGDGATEADTASPTATQSAPHRPSASDGR